MDKIMENMENNKHQGQLARTMIAKTPELAGKTVRLCGWVQIVRAHGKLIFFDLRDRSGIIQAVITPKAPFFDLAKEVRTEWVVKLVGQVKARPENMKNDKIITGGVEIAVEELQILSKAKTLPISIDGDGYEIGEDNRLKYRYLDLRRQRLQKNLVARHKVNNFLRQFLSQKDFVEIETPYISRSTPEGARDFLVPSRLQKGNFYALPQSPQQYKQLLMVAGFERYFQIARCFRDEDTRGDRQPEFTQLDIEMSFADREEIMDLNEKILIALVEELFPQKTIQEIPFPRLSYQEAMDNYGTDRPDIRNDKKNPDLLAFCWVIDFPMFEKNENGGWTFTHNPFSAPQRQFENDLLAGGDIEKIMSTQYDIVLNGGEIGGGSLRSHRPEVLEKVLEIIDVKNIQQNFGHMLEALDYGAPPHGGIAWGIDRLIMILENEPSIRETIAFPKTGDGRDLMMNAPSEIGKRQLEELGLAIIKKEKPVK